MGRLAIPRDVCERAKADIAAALEKHGPDYEWIQILAQHPQVQKGTFYRWVKAAIANGCPLERAARAVKSEAQALKEPQKEPRPAKKRPSRAQQRQSEAALVDELPAVVTMEDLQTDGFVGVQNRIDQCVRHAERVLTACETDDGRIRNPKLYLQASNHVLRSMEVAARVVQTLVDADRTKRYHDIILRRIAARDPEVVKAIIRDLRELNAQMGISIG